MPKNNNTHPYPAWNDNLADRIRNRGEAEQAQNNVQHSRDLGKIQKQSGSKG